MSYVLSCLLLATLIPFGTSIDTETDTEAPATVTTATPSNGSFVLVETPIGPIRGKTLTTLLAGKSYNAFKGIPYAEPPVGKLRFKVCDRM